MPSSVHTIKNMIKVRWNIDKAKSLQANEARQGVGFEDCVIALDEGRVLADLPHPSREQQRILVLDINDYAHVVPYVEEEDGTLFLKTVFPSRKHHAEYLDKKKP